jgi:hypothetical protein
MAKTITKAERARQHKARAKSRRRTYRNIRFGLAGALILLIWLCTREKD